MVVGYCVVCELLVLRFVVWFCVLIVLALVDSFIEVLSWLSIFLVWFGCCLCCLICFMWVCGLIGCVADFTLVDFDCGGWLLLFV